MLIDGIRGRGEEEVGRGSHGLDAQKSHEATLVAFVGGGRGCCAGTCARRHADRHLMIVKHDMCWKVEKKR